MRGTTRYSVSRSFTFHVILRPPTTNTNAAETENRKHLFYRLETMGAVPSTYNSTLSMNHEIFPRDECGTSKYYYEALQITVSVNASIMFYSNSSVDTYAYFYQHTFDPFDLTMGLLASDNNGRDSRQFRLHVSLRENTTYTLVVTTNIANTTGAFSVTVVGGAEINFTRIDHVSKYGCLWRVGQRVRDKNDNSSRPYSVFWIFKELLRHID